MRSWPAGIGGNLGAFALLLILCGNSLAVDTLGLIYNEPDSSAPSATVLQSIVNGVRVAAASQPLRIRIVAAGERYDRVQSWLQEEGITALITLGTGWDRLHSLKSHPRIVSGALDLSPDSTPQLTGVSLAVSPERFTDYLHKLLPQVRRIVVVHEAKDRWLVALAQKAAAARSMSVLAYESTDLTHGAQLYRSVIQHLVADTDALWLPISDQRLDRGQVLPWIIEESWVRRFAVFSNSLEDVRMGATFGLYPDPGAHGKRLYEIAIRSNAHGVEASEQVRSAVQVRFARHLGADLTAVHFDLEFPLE